MKTTQDVTLFRRSKLLTSVLAAACMLFFTAVLAGRPALAQDTAQGDKPTPAKITDRIMSRLKERLELSDEQAAKLKPIIEAGIQKRMELFKQMKELKKSTDTQIATVLDAKQMKKFHWMEKKFRHRMMCKRCGCHKHHRHHEWSGGDRDE